MLLHQETIITDSDFARISGFVLQHCGIHLHEGKRELVRTRLSKRLRATGYGSARDYLDWALGNQGGDELRQLVDALSTNLTSFFREPVHFDFLRDRFLPELIKRKQQRRDLTIRAWSAGCASGEEPYSIAMTLLDAVGNTAGWDIKLLANDVSTKVLQIAAAGMYDEDRVRDIPPIQKHRYFSVDRHEGRRRYQVQPCLRDIIRFRYLNLNGDWPFTGPFDFIFCRNVMIYFDRATQQRLVDRFWHCLDRSGMLFTGHSESLAGRSHGFEFVQPTIFLKP